MAGMLVSLREDFAEFLRNDEASGAKAYFTDPAVKIPVYTEKLKTVDQAITTALQSTGLSVLVATVTARGARNQAQGKLAFDDIALIARVFESTLTNKTGVPASDCAEVIAELAKRFRFERAQPLLVDISLGNDPDRLTYDVIFKIAAEKAVSVIRP